MDQYEKNLKASDAYSSSQKANLLDKHKKKKANIEKTTRAIDEKTGRPKDMVSQSTHHFDLSSIKNPDGSWKSDEQIKKEWELRKQFI